MSTWRKLGEQEGISRDTTARIRSLAAFADCLAERSFALASGDQRRLTVSGSALEAITVNMLHNSTFLYFILWTIKCASHSMV